MVSGPFLLDSTRVLAGLRGGAAQTLGSNRWFSGADLSSKSQLRGASYEGGAYYLPVIDQGRNPLKEKLILTGKKGDRDSVAETGESVNFRDLALGQFERVVLGSAVPFTALAGYALTWFNK